MSAVHMLQLVQVHRLTCPDDDFDEYRTSSGANKHCFRKIFFLDNQLYVKFRNKF